MKTLTEEKEREVLRKLLPAWSDFIPHMPTKKQLAFLMLPHKEALYGGSAGGGKSEALLMGALQYIEVPFYAAIILRRSYSDLMQPGGLLDRAMEWHETWWGDLVKYENSQHTFHFPSGASLTFGYIGQINTQEKYQGGEYQFIGFDEVTQHHPYYYTYMFSRCRKKQCAMHEGRVVDGEPAPLPFSKECYQCQKYAGVAKVPLRIRCTANPGGRGGEWVKDRFSITKNEETGRWYGANPKRPFLPAGLSDNPYIDQKTYTENLMQLPETERNQLLHGDWGSYRGGRFKPQWAKTYQVKGDYYLLEKETHHKRNLLIFCVADIAGSLRTGAGEPDPDDPYSHPFLENRRASFTVLSTWACTSSLDLLLLDIVRLQKEAPEILLQAKEVCRKWAPSKFIIETNGPGLPVAQLAQSMGIPVVPLFQHRDKVANSWTAQIRMELGKIYLPHEDLGLPWLEKYKDELFNWTGHPHEVDDQVDVTSNAANQIMLSSPDDMFDPTVNGYQEAISASEPYVPVYDSSPLLPYYSEVESPLDLDLY